MDSSSPFRPSGDSAPSSAPGVDPRLQPTPDYGTLGPGSDAAGYGQSANQTPPRKSPPKVFHIVAALAGIIAALLANAVKNTHPSHPGVLKSTAASAQSVKPGRGQAPEKQQLDQMYPQKQAETLLQEAVSHSPGAVEEISSRVDEWNGKVQWNAQIASLSTAALNSEDMRVRESGVEVELAAYGLAKNSQSLEYLLKAVDSDDHAQKIWALWALGLMANRGVEAERIVDLLVSHLTDGDVESRQWAVEGLAVSGSEAALAPLMKAMHDDTAPVVRERAACSVAESGMFTPAQRSSVVPQLITFTDDPSLDAQTHSWAFHALSDITHQNFGNDSNAWRNWYQRQ